MKALKRLAPLALCIFAAAAAAPQAQARGIRDDADMAGEKARASFAFGMTVGYDFLEAGLEIDYAAFVEGLMAAMEGSEGDPLPMTRREALEAVQIAFESAMERQRAQMRAREDAFLAENAAAPGVIQTASGLQHVELERGSGPMPSAGDAVIIHYEGTFLGGEVFDSSRMRDEPATFPLAMVIPGLAEGIQLMAVGGRHRFYIPSRLAYGARGDDWGIVPPFATLIFTVELLGIAGAE